LLAAELPLPRAVWAHGYVQWSGAKMSKTAGTAVGLGDAIDYHGADALRYFLLREVGFESDGDFTWERLDARYTADLADTLGNLVKRSLDMIHRYRNGTVPATAGGRTAPLDRAARDIIPAYQRAMDEQRLAEGAASWIELAARANGYIQETVPWELAKAGKDAELDQVLAGLAPTVARLAVLGEPFVPATARAIWALFPDAPPLETVRLDRLQELVVSRQRIAKSPILFPKPKPAPA
jgi:methionyl-tRNA synthetase